MTLILSGLLDNPIASYVAKTSQGKSLVKPFDRAAELPKPGVKIPVIQSYNSASYQHLYQKGFRAGRRHEAERRNSEIRELKVKLAYTLDDVKSSQGRLGVMSHNVVEAKRKLTFTRCLFAGILLGDLWVVYLLGHICG